MGRHRPGTADHAAQLGWLAAAMVEVRRDTTAEIQGFADIQHSASSVAKEVDTWSLREFGEMRLPGVIHGAWSVPLPSPAHGRGSKLLPRSDCMLWRLCLCSIMMSDPCRSDRAIVQYSRKAQPLSRTPAGARHDTVCYQVSV